MRFRSGIAPVQRFLSRHFEVVLTDIPDIHSSILRNSSFHRLRRAIGLDRIAPFKHCFRQKCIALVGKTNLQKEIIL